MAHGTAQAVFCFSYLYYGRGLPGGCADGLLSFQKNREEVFYTAAVFLRRYPGRKRDLQAAVPVLRGKSGAIRLVVFSISAVQPSHVFLPAPAPRKKQEAAADHPDLYAGF